MKESGNTNGVEGKDRGSNSKKNDQTNDDEELYDSLTPTEEIDEEIEDELTGVTDEDCQDTLFEESNGTC